MSIFAFGDNSLCTAVLSSDENLGLPTAATDALQNQILTNKFTCKHILEFSQKLPLNVYQYLFKTWNTVFRGKTQLLTKLWPRPRNVFEVIAHNYLSSFFFHYVFHWNTFKLQHETNFCCRYCYREDVLGIWFILTAYIYKSLHGTLWNPSEPSWNPQKVLLNPWESQTYYWNTLKCLNFLGTPQKRP